jgi:hypothetical protein
MLPWCCGQPHIGAQGYHTLKFAPKQSPSAMLAQANWLALMGKKAPSLTQPRQQH